MKKIYLLIFAAIALCVLFAFALKAETGVRPASAQAGIKLPIVMYHHVTEKSSRAGDYVIKTTELEADLDYIQKRGYTTVTVADLIEFSQGKKDLPEKIIMITFDDGFESVRKLAWPLLKERKMTAVLSPVGAVTELYTQNGDDNINYAYMTWEELNEIDKSDEFEVQSHTYDMHHTGKNERKGISRKNGESAEDYETVLTEDLTKMQKLLKKNSDIIATAVVYPYGCYSKATLDIVKSLGYKCTMLCEQRVNVIRKGDEESLFDLGRFNRPSGKSTEEFFKKLFE